MAKVLVETCRVKNGFTSPPFFALVLSTQYDFAPRLVELHALSHLPDGYRMADKEDDSQVDHSRQGDSVMVFRVFLSLLGRE